MRWLPTAKQLSGLGQATPVRFVKIEPEGFGFGESAHLGAAATGCADATPCSRLTETAKASARRCMYQVTV